MNLILTVAKRELKVFFDSLIAYVMLFVFLGFSGFFTWLYGNDIFLVGQANLKTFFAVASWTLFFLHTSNYYENACRGKKVWYARVNFNKVHF